MLSKKPAKSHGINVAMAELRARKEKIASRLSKLLAGIDDEGVGFLLAESLAELGGINASMAELHARKEKILSQLPALLAEVDGEVAAILMRSMQEQSSEGCIELPLRSHEIKRGKGGQWSLKDTPRYKALIVLGFVLETFEEREGPMGELAEPKPFVRIKW